MMKTLLKRPGFEAIFTLTILLMVVLPAMVYAQQGYKYLAIIVKNGDTTVNGKKISSLTPKEKADARKAFGELSTGKPLTVSPSPQMFNGRMAPPRGSMRDSMHRPGGDTQMFRGQPRPGMMGGRMANMQPPQLLGGGINRGPGMQGQQSGRPGFGGGQGRGMQGQQGGRPGFGGGQDRGMQGQQGGRPGFGERQGHGMQGQQGGRPGFGGGQGRGMDRGRGMRGGRGREPGQFGHGMPGMHPGGGPEEQAFNFNTTDKNGISTRLSFRVATAGPDMVKKLSGADASTVEITDLTFTPEFSTGKTTLAFTLGASGAADVSLTDSDGKALWTEKAGGAKFTKSLMLPLNGVYFLVVKQGGKAAVKRIVKE